MRRRETARTVALPVPGRAARSRPAAARLAVLWAVLAAGVAAADPPVVTLGLPWEPPILDGIRQQEQDAKARSAQAILLDAKARAARRADATTNLVRTYLLARAYGKAGDAASARATYAEVLAQEPRCYFAWRDLGILDGLRQPPDVAAADRNLRKALAVHPGFSQAAWDLGKLLVGAGRDAEALPFLQRFVESHPSDLSARSLLAMTLVRLERFADAAQQVRLLRQQDARSPMFRDLEADLVLRQGDPARARDLYKQLAADFPGEKSPLHGYVRSLEALKKKTGQADPDEYLWGIELLWRLERDPAKRQELGTLRDQIRAAIARQAQPTPATPAGPPTDAQVVEVLRGPKPEGRTAALRYVFAQEKAPSAEVLRAVMERLGAREPHPNARQWALRVIGRFGGYGLAGLVRHSLKDADASVRVTAVDALVTLGERDASARGAAVLVLGTVATSASPDRTLLASARMGVLELVRGDLGLPTESEEAHRAAFATWWAGPLGTEAKIRSLEAFPRLKDLAPEEVLRPYVRDAEFSVVAAAYRALVASKPAAPRGALAAWWGALPALAPEQLVPERRAEVAARLDAWWNARPAS